jgi:hypothetical protein
MSVGAAAALALSVQPAAAQPESATETDAAESPDATADPKDPGAPAEAEGPEQTPPAAPPPPEPARASEPAGGYYTEPPPAGGDPDRPPQASAAPPLVAVHEPPPPGMGPIYEPPPPPEPDHVAPKNSFWAGARGGWWIPFGSAWGRCTLYYSNGSCAEGASFALRDFVSAGPMVQVDLGARLGRLYNVFVAWEHAELGGGNAELARILPDGTAVEMPRSDRGSTNFYGLGVRFSSDADRVGFLAELILGYRDLAVEWAPEDVPVNGIERLTMNQAPLEFRFGLGADIRLHPLFSLSPLFTVGSGRFGNIEQQLEDGSKEDAMGPEDLFAAHGWFTLQLGAHFDFFGQ